MPDVQHSRTYSRTRNLKTISEMIPFLRGMGASPMGPRARRPCYENPFLSHALPRRGRGEGEIVYRRVTN